jgi:hypothetical protein
MTRTKTTAKKTPAAKKITTKKVLAKKIAGLPVEDISQIDYPDTEGMELSDPIEGATEAEQIAADKKEIKARKMKMPKALNIWQGTIECDRLCYRKMEEFKNCQAWAWMAINTKTNTVTYANSYGPEFGQIKASYDPTHYTYPIKQKIIDKKLIEYQELESPADWPRFFTTYSEKPSATTKKNRKDK